METSEQAKEILRRTLRGTPNDNEVEPPPQLARRTCEQIWSTLDMEEQTSTSNEHEPKVDSVLGFVFDPFKTVVAIPFGTESLIPKETNRKSDTKPIKKLPASPQKTTHWIGLTVSISVGIVIAFFLFPMIRYAERSTRSYVADNWMTEINRRVDQYEQIYGVPSPVPAMEETPPFNLAQNGWQELCPEVFRSSSFPWATPARSFEELMTSGESKPSEQHSPEEVIRGQQRSFLAGFDHWDEPILLDTNGFSDSMLLSMPGEGNSVRSAFGRGILLKDGRVFFRILPGTKAP